jgi:nicotinamidase/pyrazinamidase
MKGKKALLVVDVQRDFCPGGPLPVKNGDKVIEPINRMVRLFTEEGLPTIFTRDWHPHDHCSFKAYGGIWPPHCIQDTPGATFHPSLLVPRGALIVSKATDPGRDAYSGFQGTELARKLAEEHVVDVYIAGLATDYCVMNTVLDALKEGFTTHVLTDCIRGVNLKPTDSANALKIMAREGAKKLTSAQLYRQIRRRVAVSSSS